ncbi:hypothetical protein LAZ67_X003902 [Cordylochernes scorpioides]|uniref:RNA-directed DNA polymerase n=1 Tax=Cordylochernes scorpioides TaxID=51811 RepID=A0ABY6LUI1_9ARAC|nr:hypothetical protein LAZ67_X003902 [Cordylochernes scorpioides]
MSTYEYEIRYIKGSKQHEADLLSRNPFCGFLSAAQIKEKQPLELPYPNATINPEGLHTLTRKGVTKVIVPPSLQHTLINKVHVEYNHPGVSQMTRIISTQYTWRGMTHSIVKYVRSCPTSQLIKRPKGPNYGTLGQLPPVSHPFDTLSIDTIAEFSKYGSSKTYLHVIVDHLSRYAWTFPSKSTSTLTYLQCLKKVMQSNTPKCLLSDRAPAFTSPKFRRFLLRHGIQPLLTTSNNPQANGLCERLNATLTGKLRILHLENPKVSWIKLIKTVTDKYNQTPHTITGFPPSFLMYNIIPTELSSHIDPYPPVEEARKIAIKRTLDRHAKEKIKYDSKHRTPQFEVGDIVLVKVYHHPNSDKLLPYFTGPYTILEIISPNVVRINRANQPLNRDNDTVHVNKLKYYTEEVLYIAPPQKYSLPNKNNRKPTNLSPYNHFPPDLFDNSTNRHIPPRSSEPFLHLTPDTFKDFNTLIDLCSAQVFSHLEDVDVELRNRGEVPRRAQSGGSGTDDRHRANMTSRLQPLDQGIIQNVKTLYRREIAYLVLDSIEKGESVHGALTDAEILNLTHLDEEEDEEEQPPIPVTLSKARRSFTALCSYVLRTDTTAALNEEAWVLGDLNISREVCERHCVRFRRSPWKALGQGQPRRCRVPANKDLPLRKSDKFEQTGSSSATIKP